MAGDLLPDVAAGAEIKQMMELTEVAATHRHKDKGSRVAELYRQIQVVSKLSTACQYFCLHKALCLNTLIMLLLQGQGRTVASGEEEDGAQTPLNNTAPSPGPVSSCDTMLSLISHCHCQVTRAVPSTNNVTMRGIIS